MYDFLPYLSIIYYVVQKINTNIAKSNDYFCIYKVFFVIFR